LLIAAGQALDLIVGEVRELTENTCPFGNALPIMPIDDTLYFRQVSHCNNPQAAAFRRMRRDAPAQHNNNVQNFNDLIYSLINLFFNYVVTRSR
jgi:hypothetical protein